MQAECIKYAQQATQIWDRTPERLFLGRHLQFLRPRLPHSNLCLLPAAEPEHGCRMNIRATWLDIVLRRENDGDGECRDGNMDADIVAGRCSKGDTAAGRVPSTAVNFARRLSSLLPQPSRTMSVTAQQHLKILPLFPYHHRTPNVAHYSRPSWRDYCSKGLLPYKEHFCPNPLCGHPSTFMSLATFLDHFQSHARTKLSNRRSCSNKMYCPIKGVGCPFDKECRKGDWAFRRRDSLKEHLRSWHKAAV